MKAFETSHYDSETWHLTTLMDLRRKNFFDKIQNILYVLEFNS